MREIAKSRVIFLLVFALICLLATAINASGSAGLDLYSYQDNQGQLIVVDSLERIPEQYRDLAKKSFIPSFRNPSPQVTEQVEKTGDPRVVVISSPAPVLSSDAKMTIVEPLPEEEPPDPAFASAALIIDEMGTIIRNYETIYGLAFNHSFKHPAVMHHHLLNVNLMRKLAQPSSLVWRELNDWTSMATQALERLRTIQYTVSAWFQTGASAPMLTTLPTLTEAARRNLQVLTTHLKKLEEEAAARAKEKAEAAARLRILKKNRNL